MPRCRFTNTLALVTLLFFVAACGACAKTPPPSQERDSAWAAPMRVEGLPNLHRVTPDLYRSAQPDETGFARAKAMGIKTVLSLRSSNPDVALNKEAGLQLRRTPMKAWKISEAELVGALRNINNSPKPVLVHCLHGADRTGLTIAMYRLVFQGWSKEAAKDEMINGGYGFHAVWKNIPEQIDAIDVEALAATVLGPRAAAER